MQCLALLGLALNLLAIFQETADTWNLAYVDEPFGTLTRETNPALELFPPVTLSLCLLHMTLHACAVGDFAIP